MNGIISSSIGCNRIPSFYMRSDVEGIFDEQATHHVGALSLVRNEDCNLNCITTPLLTSMFLNDSSEQKNPLASIKKCNELKRKKPTEDNKRSRTKTRRKRKISEDATSSIPSLPSTLCQSKKGIKIITSKIPAKRYKVNLVL